MFFNIQYPDLPVDDVSMTGGTATDVTVANVTVANVTSTIPGIYTIDTDSFVEGPVTLTITGWCSNWCCY